jgi:hypothetical protein
VKTEIKYGIGAGLGVCGWVLLQFLLGFHTTRLEYGRWTNQLSLFILIGCWFFMLRTKRDRDFSGSLTFGQGFKAGLVASVLAAVIITGFSLLYNHVINPGWMQRAMDWEISRLRAAGAPASEIAGQTAAFQSFSTVGSQVINGIVGTVLMGMIIAVIITMMLRRPPAAGSGTMP